MVRMLSWFVVLVMTAVSLAWAQSQFGTAAEAKAMLQRAVEALKKDKAQALASFNAGTEGFKDKDLYVTCYDLTTGLSTANLNQPSLVGTAKITERKDVDGKEYGKEFLAKATEGGFNEVTYKFPRPGETVPVEKSTFVTKVGDALCGVGYYK
jgi:hypothetical protein